MNLSMILLRVAFVWSVATITPGPNFFVTMQTCSLSLAAEVDGDTQKEVLHLFAYLENSNCQFNRNGSWYSPHEAVQHIEKKYRYLIKKGLINSTEQFIERAASKSSISGKAYLVKCDNAESVESSIWFTDELRRFRKTVP